MHGRRALLPFHIPRKRVCASAYYSMRSYKAPHSTVMAKLRHFEGRLSLTLQDTKRNLRQYQCCTACPCLLSRSLGGPEPRLLGVLYLQQRGYFDAPNMQALVPLFRHGQVAKQGTRGTKPCLRQGRLGKGLKSGMPQALPQSLLPPTTHISNINNSSASAHVHPPTTILLNCGMIY